MTTSERFFLRVLKDSGNRFKVAEIMANRIRIGVVGAGTMPQRAHIPNLLAESQRCTIVALADARVETARLVAERYGIPSVYPDVQTLLADSDVDAIVISVPDQAH